MLRVIKHQWNKIYTYDWWHFGDSWAITSYLLKISEESGKPVRYYPTNSRQRDNILQIRPYLKSKGIIHIVEQSPEVKLPHPSPYNKKFVKAIRTWDRQHAKRSRIVAYQFDGNHWGEYKNPSGEQLNRLLDSLRKFGYNPVDVGGHRPISYIINTLSNCKFFVGCPSGIAVAARSVCCPSYLITFNLCDAALYWLKTCQYPGMRMFKYINDFLPFARKEMYKFKPLC